MTYIKAQQSQQFFLLEEIPTTLEPTLLPIAQLLNLEKIDLSALKKLITFGLPEQSGILREYVWKVVLGYLPKERKKWGQHITKQEQTYSSFINLYLSSSKYAQAPLVMSKHHPEWQSYEADHQLWEQIQKDTCRTHAGLSFFSQPAEQFIIPFYTTTRRQKYKLISGDQDLEFLTEEQKKKTYNYDHMTRILFIFARLNPKVNYVQGMNEILAPILYLISTARPGPIQEAACFFMFNNVMSDLLDMHIKDFGNTAENPIHNKINSVSTMLLALHPKTWHKLEQLKVDPFFYTFRWLTLLFSQQFQMYETLKIWQSIFSHTDRNKYTLFLAISMLISSAHVIARSDYSEIMAHLKAINQTVSVDTVIQKANYLYDKYINADFSELAQMNRKKLTEKKKDKNKIFSFLKKLL